jgi:tetratricopeptide (TPR) repeat protein
MIRLSNRVAIFLCTLIVSCVPNALWAQATVDPFPLNFQELIKIGEKNKGLANAIQAFAEGNPQKLKESLVEAKTASPDFPKPDVMLARMFMANRQFGEALSVLESHLTTNPNDADAYKCMAEVAMISGRWTDAWLQLEKAGSLMEGMQYSVARKQSFVIDLTRLRAEAAERRQDLTLSAKLFAELEKLQPKEGFPIWSQGRLKIAAGDLDGGITLLKKAKQLTPTLPQPELAVALEQLGRKDSAKAESWFKDGIRAKETSTEANWIQYLKFLIDEDRASEAKGLIEKAPPEFQKSRDMKLLKALSHRYLNEDAEAEKLFSELHQANPDDLDAADQLALVLVETRDEGKRARAGQISESNLRQAPNVEKVAATAAWVKFKTGSVDVADNLLGQIVKGGRISAQTLYYSAMLLKARGKTAEAMQFLKAAVDAPGSFPQKKAAKAELPAAAAPAPATAPATTPATVPKATPGKK